MLAATPPELPEDRLATGLHERGWVVLPGFLSPPEVLALHTELAARRLRGELAAAGIGHARRPDAGVRRDRTCWLEGDTPAQQQFLARMETLRLAINRCLFLGLFEFEAHFAHYPPGAFYRRHRDAFISSDARVVSAVCYLNDGWQAADGGELVIWPQPRTRTVAATVLPEAGTLACFLSEQVPHEVRPTQRDRCSIAGWFRRNASSQWRADPAG